jgi:hypothetical protein
MQTSTHKFWIDGQTILKTTNKRKSINVRGALKQFAELFGGPFSVLYVLDERKYRSCTADFVCKLLPTLIIIVNFAAFSGMGSPEGAPHFILNPPM